MSRQIPSSMSEHLSIDNLPTGSVLLLIRRHEMPDAICVERYWEGMESPDQIKYVPERTCHVESKLLIEGEYVPYPYYEYEMECCGGFKWDDDEPPAHCPCCGARIEVKS